jgi:hypothetical protein
MPRRLTLATVAMTIAAILSACGSTGATGAAPSSEASVTASPATDHQQTTSAGPSESPVSPESPVPTEISPPGDIPDDIAFVPYHSAKGGWTITVPEGWSRTTDGTTVTFTDKLNAVQVDAEPGPPVSEAAAKKTDVPALNASTRSFTLVGVSTASLPAGPAILINYQANSDPNAVTGKQYRLDVLRYELFHHGTRTTLTLLSPVGADNVDPWRIVSQSLRVA